MENDTTYKPDGLNILEDIHKDLLNQCTNANSSLSFKLLSHLIAKIELVIKVINYNPRLPLYQIEQSIIEICKRDKNTHGVNVKIYFTTKFEEINHGKLSTLMVEV